MKRAELDQLLYEVAELVGGLLDDFDEGRDCGAAVEAIQKLHRVVEIFDLDDNN